MPAHGQVSEEAVCANLVRAMVTSAAIEMETLYWLSSWEGPDGVRPRFSVTTTGSLSP